MKKYLKMTEVETAAAAAAFDEVNPKKLWGKHFRDGLQAAVETVINARRSDKMRDAAPYLLAAIEDISRIDLDDVEDCSPAVLRACLTKLVNRSREIFSAYSTAPRKPGKPTRLDLIERIQVVTETVRGEKVLDQNERDWAIAILDIRQADDVVAHAPRTRLTDWCFYARGQMKIANNKTLPEKSAERVA